MMISSTDFKVTLKVWEHSVVWACGPTQAPEVQESDCLEWLFWYGPIFVLGLVKWRPQSRHNLGKIWRILQPQTNAVCTHFDLLTSFWQGNRSMDEWYNAVQAQVNLAKYPSETAQIFWFLLHDEEFVSKTINDSNVDLKKFPASKVTQLAKKMESSKATVCHMMQVAGDPQDVQINLMRHQCTEIPPGKHKKKIFC